MSSLNSYQETDLKIDFHGYWLALKRRSFIAASVFIGIIALTFIYVIFKKPVFKSSGSVLIEPQNSSLLTGLETLSTGELKSLGKQSDPLITEIEVIRSYPVLKETAETLAVNGSYISILNLQKGIEVEPLPGTDLLTISYQASDPILAATVAETLIDVYIETNVRNNRAEASAARSFIEAQLPKTAEAVREAELKLRSFKEENQIVTLDDEASRSIEAIAELESLMAEAKAQLAKVNSQSSGLLQDSEIDLATTSDSNRLNLSPNIQVIAEQLGQIQNQLATDRNRYHSEHPAIAALEQEEAELKAKIRQAQLAQVKTQRQSLENEISKLSELQSVQKAKANTYPKLEQTKRELERNLSAAQITYESLLKNLQKVRVVENQTIANVQIVSPPQVPEKPVETSRKLILLGGFILATLTALASAFTTDLLDSSVKDIQQAKNLLDYPLIGVIPYFYTSKNKKLLPSSDSDPKFKAERVFTENNPFHVSMIHAYNSLQANLDSSSLDKNAKVIVVTSSVSHEGKSEVSANLAAAYVRTGKRVLLVDADRCQPTQHHIWGLTNAPGLSKALEGQTDLQSVFQEVLPNLFLLPSGNLPTHAITKLDSSSIKYASLISEKFFLQQLINKVSKDYDIIIFDTASIIEAIVPSFLNQIADRTIFVVRPGIVDISNIKIARQILSSFNRQTLSIVANAVDDNDPNRFFYPHSALIQNNSPNGIAKLNSSSNLKSALINNNKDN